MLDVNDAREVIKQLSKEQFLCNDDVISTKGYVIVKKTNVVTTDNVWKAVMAIKKSN